MTKRDKALWIMGTPLWAAAALLVFRVWGVSWAAIWEFLFVAVASLLLFVFGFVILLLLVEGIAALFHNEWDA